MDVGNTETPIWEQVLKEIAETRRDLCERLDRIAEMAYKERADLRSLEDRLDKLESKAVQ